MSVDDGGRGAGAAVFGGSRAGTELTVKAATRDYLTATAAAARKQRVPGRCYECVSRAEHRRVETTLADVDPTFERNDRNDRNDGGVATMNQDAKAQLCNDQ